MRQPAAACCCIGVDYPAPLVDLALERESALERYRTARAGFSADSSRL